MLLLATDWLPFKEPLKVMPKQSNKDISKPKYQRMETNELDVSDVYYNKFLINGKTESNYLS
jgi:hypothetical protein